MLGLLIPPDGKVSAVELAGPGPEVQRALGNPTWSAYDDFQLPGVAGYLRIYYAVHDVPWDDLTVNRHARGLIDYQRARAASRQPGRALVMRVELKDARGRRRVRGLTVNDCLAIAIAIVRNERWELEA